MSSSILTIMWKTKLFLDLKYHNSCLKNYGLPLITSFNITALLTQWKSDLVYVFQILYI